MVSQIILSNGTTLSYGYDAEERITSVVETYTVDDQTITNTTLYTYDALGQLLTETVNGEVVNSMEYDNYGNITSKNDVAYTYDSIWKDKLTSYGGQSITYDAQGNPTSYLGHALTWEKGRQLKSFDGNTYTYNANGIRTSKTVNGVTHNYTLDGTKILREEWNGNTIVPLYDNQDSVCGIIYNEKPYYFIKNLQSDVIAIVNKNAETVARYSYDAWGKILSVTDVNGIDISTDTSHIATINPFRYRCYYYDEEIGLYYLQSRYYDASVDKFINEDELTFLKIDNILPQKNLYTYCKNNPVVNSDPTGYWYISLSALSKILLALAVNPIATVLIAWGIKKLKALLIAKYTVLLAKLGAFWGPVVQGIIIVAGALLGIPSISDFALALWDCVLQKKKGIKFTVKKTWFGVPYQLDFYAA